MVSALKTLNRLASYEPAPAPVKTKSIVIDRRFEISPTDYFRVGKTWIDDTETDVILTFVKRDPQTVRFEENGSKIIEYKFEDTEDEDIAPSIAFGPWKIVGFVYISVSGSSAYYRTPTHVIGKNGKPTVKTEQIFEDLPDGFLTKDRDSVIEYIVNGVNSGTYYKCDLPSDYWEISDAVFKKIKCPFETVQVESNLIDEIVKRSSRYAVQYSDRYERRLKNIILTEFYNKYPGLDSGGSSGVYSFLVGLPLNRNDSEINALKAKYEMKDNLRFYTLSNSIHYVSEVRAVASEFKNIGINMTVYRPSLFEGLKDIIRENAELRYSLLVITNHVSDVDQAEDWLTEVMDPKYDSRIDRALNDIWLYLNNYAVNMNKTFEHLDSFAVASFMDKMSVQTLYIVYALANIYNEKTALAFFRELITKPYSFARIYGETYYAYDSKANEMYGIFEKMMTLPRVITEEDPWAEKYNSPVTAEYLMFGDLTMPISASNISGDARYFEDGICRFKIPDAKEDSVTSIVPSLLNNTKAINMSYDLLNAWKMIFSVRYNIIYRDGNRVDGKGHHVKIPAKNLYTYNEVYTGYNPKPALALKLASVASKVPQCQSEIERITFPKTYADLYHENNELEVLRRKVCDKGMAVTFRRAASNFTYLDGIKVDGMRLSLITESKELPMMGDYFSNCLHMASWVQKCTYGTSLIFCLEPDNIEDHIYRTDIKEGFEIRPFAVSVNTTNGDINQFKTFHNMKGDVLTEKEIAVGMKLQDAIYDIYERMGKRIPGTPREYSADMNGKREASTTE